MHYKKICKIMKKKLKITTKYDSKVRSQLNSDTAMIGMIFLHGVFDGPGISARVIAFHDIAGSGIDQPPSQVDLLSQYSCSTVLVRVMQVPQFLECSLLWIQGNHFLWLLPNNIKYPIDHNYLSKLYGLWEDELFPCWLHLSIFTQSVACLL